MILLNILEQIVDLTFILCQPTTYIGRIYIPHHDERRARAANQLASAG